MAEEWGPWIEHDGKTVPVPVGTVCWVLNGKGREGSLRVEDHGVPEDCFIWGSLAPQWWDHRILSYRIRRPRALLQLIEIAANLPAPVQPKVEA